MKLYLTFDHCFSDRKTSVMNFPSSYYYSIKIAPKNSKIRTQNSNRRRFLHRVAKSMVSNQFLLISFHLRPSVGPQYDRTGVYPQSTRCQTRSSRNIWTILKRNVNLERTTIFTSATLNVRGIDIGISSISSI